MLNGTSYNTTSCNNCATATKAEAISYAHAYERYAYASELEEVKSKVNGLEMMVKDNDKKELMSKSISKINIIAPNKVVEVTFADGQKEKMICHEEDVFDLRTCLFIAMAKHLYKKTLTYEGIEHKAKELMYEKESVKIVNSALKEFRKNEEFVKSEKRRIEEEKETAKRKKEKLIERKKRRREKKEAAERERLIEIQTEAYVRAMELIKIQKA